MKSLGEIWSNAFKKVVEPLLTTQNEFEKRMTRIEEILSVQFDLSMSGSGGSTAENLTELESLSANQTEIVKSLEKHNDRLCLLEKTLKSLTEQLTAEAEQLESLGESGGLEERLTSLENSVRGLQTSLAKILRGTSQNGSSNT